MMRTRWTRIWIGMFLAACWVGLAPSVRAADDTARFNGAWKTNLPYNGQMITIVSVHTGSDYKNYVLVPNGRTPIGDGRLSAVDGKWTLTSLQGNDSGTYQFVDDNTAICKNAAGQTVVWQKDNSPLPPIIGAAPAAPVAKLPAVNPPPPARAPDVSQQLRAEIQAKMQARDYEGALSLLNQHGAAASPDPLLCITHARLMLQMENYRQARTEMTYFLQHTFDNPDAYVVHAQACAAMGDLRWADQDLRVAAQLRPASAEADRKSITPYAAIDPPGFGPAELPAKLDELVRMAAAKWSFDSLVKQAMGIVKGGWNIRKVEADEYRDRKRQLTAAALANPQHAQPFVELASFLYEQASYIHGDAREGVGVVAFRLVEPDPERQQAIAWAQAALKIDPKNARAMAVVAGAMIALGDDVNARPYIGQALSINPNEPELLRMFSQLETRAASKDSDMGDQLSMPAVWEDDKYRYMQTRSEQDLALARRYNAAASEENSNAATALQSAVSSTQGTAAGFYYQGIQALRRGDTAGGAAAMEQAVKLAPENIEYHDYLAYFYEKMGWRKESEFFAQRSIADNLGETTASKMLRLAYKQLRRTEYAAARQTLAEAMRIDPADPRGPAYMGLLIAGENKNRAHADQSANWLMAACALETASLRLRGLEHATPNILYTPDQVGLEEGLVIAAGETLMSLNRPADALLLARRAIDDTNRVDKTRWAYSLPSAMLPIPSVQETPVPHMDPVKAAPIYNTTIWVIKLHELAGDALKATGQTSQASQEYAAARSLQQSMENTQRNAPRAPLRR